MADRVGQKLGNYRLLRLLGRGGFAEVYLGEHLYLETTAAIKVLYARIASEDVEQFRAEAKTIARLVHPNIVRVLDFGVSEATPFLVIDYAPNGTLRKRYPRGIRLPLATIINCVNQIADALQYAHEQHIVHRDVKPENMLIGRRNEILLSDFGIALVAQTGHSESTQGVQDMAGTVAYMAPEQIQAKAETASDQYALGIVVYEWLCGSRPFQGSFTEVAVKHSLVPPPPLRTLLPGLPSAIEAVVMRALEKEPGKRYPTVKDFAIALERAYREVREQDASTRADGQEQDRQSAATMIFSQEDEIGSMPVLVQPATDPLLATSVPLSEDSEATMQTPDLDYSHSTATILTEPENASAASKTPLIERSTSGTFTRRAIISGLAGASVIGLGGLTWLALGKGMIFPMTGATPTTTQGGTLLTYAGHMGPVWSVRWSPDGKYLASASSDHTVQVWDAMTGIPAYIYNDHHDTVYGLAWSPDGKRIASASYDKTVRVWDATTGYYPIVYSGHNSWIWTVAWSPDGKYIASGGGDKVVQVWEAATGNVLTSYTGHDSFILSLAWSPDSKYVASASSDKTVQVWSAENGAVIYTYRPYSTALWAVAWARDGKRIVSGSDDRTVQVWDALNGDHRYIYYGHTDFVYAVAWSPDGQYVVSGGDDKTAQVWNSMDGSNPFIYQGHSDTVRSLAWSPDGKFVASASFDKTVKVWHALG